MDYQIILKLFLLSFFAFVGGAVLIASILWIVLVFKQQFKLKYSITLVELRVPKLPYFIMDCLLIVVIFILMFESVNTDEDTARFLMDSLGFNKTEIIIFILCIMAMAVGALGITLTLTFAKSAVMDRGVHFGTGFLDWYHLYDYHVDEANCRVILSSNKNGPLTLQGTSVPFKYNKSDAEKLKFILNKNKNKFVPRYEL